MFSFPISVFATTYIWHTCPPFGYAHLHKYPTHSLSFHESCYDSWACYICQSRQKPPGNRTEGNDLRPSPIHGTLRLHNYETNYKYKICIYFRSVFLNNSANRCNCMNVRLASMFLRVGMDCSHIHCNLKHKTHFTYAVKYRPYNTLYWYKAIQL